MKSTLKISGFAERASELFAAGAGNKTFHDAVKALGCTPDPHLVSAMIEVYRSHSPEISLPADSVHCLEKVKDFARLGLITDGRPFAQEAKCESLGLSGTLSRIVCTGTWGEEFHKPHQRAFAFMEDQLGSSADTFIYVADNPVKDFTAPLARGWLTIRIRRVAGLHAHEPATQHCPHVELQDLWRLPQVISAMAGCFRSI